MRKKTRQPIELTLKRETIRILKAEVLTLVVGGSEPSNGQSTCPQCGPP